jgi:virginiamycin B lyase
MGVAVGGSVVWVANRSDDTVSRIDPRTNQVVATIPVGSSPSGVAVGEGSVWVANSGDGTVSQIHAQTNELVGTIPIGEVPIDVAAGEGAVWVLWSTETGEAWVSRMEP